VKTRGNSQLGLLNMTKARCMRAARLLHFRFREPQ
jgi:hypothetical protein